MILVDTDGHHRTVGDIHQRQQHAGIGQQVHLVDHDDDLAVELSNPIDERAGVRALPPEIVGEQGVVDEAVQQRAS